MPTGLRLGCPSTEVSKSVGRRSAGLSRQSPLAGAVASQATGPLLLGEVSYFKAAGVELVVVEGGVAVILVVEAEVET